MSAPDFAQVKASLGRARALPADARKRFLAELASEDPSLFAEVTSLLAHEDGELPGLDQLMEQLPAPPRAHIEHLPGGRTIQDGPRTYELLRLLGRGGFGEVYLARLRDGDLVRHVALKLLHAARAQDEAAVARLRDEARLLTALRHPAILAVLALIETDGRLGLVTEYVEGADLAECLVASPPPGPRATLEVVGQVADALATAWRAHGVVHRDVKPHNIRIGIHGNVKLLDFGIARSDGLHRDAHTGSEHLLGTIRYLAPERLRVGQPPGPASDVFALGAVLYEGLVGRPLLDGLDLPRLVRLSDTPEELARHLEARIDEVELEGVREILRDTLQVDPEQRLPAAELAERCDELAHQLPRTESLRAWCQRHAWADGAPPDAGAQESDRSPPAREGATSSAGASGSASLGRWIGVGALVAGLALAAYALERTLVPSPPASPTATGAIASERVEVRTEPLPAPPPVPEPPPTSPPSPPGPAVSRPRAAPPPAPLPDEVGTASVVEVAHAEPVYPPVPAEELPGIEEPQAPVVDVSVLSIPADATIVHAASGEVLGTTPAEVDVPEGGTLDVVLIHGESRQRLTLRSRNASYMWLVATGTLRTTTRPR